MPDFLNFAIRAHNSIHGFLSRRNSKPVASSSEVREIEDRAARFPSDIADHLPLIFTESIAMTPRLIVELGVRGGESRFVFERVARLTGSFLVSADLDDCSHSCTAAPKWYFLKGDDIHFAGEFAGWCKTHDINPGVDVLFIDTSHLYEHTVEEIKSWFPFLNSRCKVIFHDTNLRNLSRRFDGTLLRGWDNHRGVIRAIEEFLGTRFNERMDFSTTIGPWTVRHWAHSAGLTILERAAEPASHI